MSLITKFTLGQVSQTSLDLHPHYLNPHLLPPWRTKDEGSKGKGTLSVCVFSGAEALIIRRCKMMAWTPLIYICKIFMEPMNPMDQGPMELQDNKDTGDTHSQRQQHSLCQGFPCRKRNRQTCLVVC